MRRRATTAPRWELGARSSGAGAGSVATQPCVECGGAGEVTISAFDVEPRAAEGLRRIPDDPRLVQYGAAAGLVAALAFLALLLFG